MKTSSLHWKKNCSAWDHGCFVNVCKFRGCSCIFLYIGIRTSLLGSRTIHQIWWLEVFLDSRLQYESLEGLIDFLAFLLQRLWPNFRVLIREKIKQELYRCGGLSSCQKSFSQNFGRLDWRPGLGKDVWKIENTPILPARPRRTPHPN